VLETCKAARIAAIKLKVNSSYINAVARAHLAVLMRWSWWGLSKSFSSRDAWLAIVESVKPSDFIPGMR